MPDPSPNAELLRSLGRLVRGLSALFWGLPIALIVCVWTANPQWLKSFGVVPPLVSTGWLVYGLWQLREFQKQERVWHRVLDRTFILSIINFGLSPFLYWWSRIPSNDFFIVMLALLALCSLMFLGCLNLVLQRLGAMLPDEALRMEIKQFTALNLNLLAATFAFGALYFGLMFIPNLPGWIVEISKALERAGFWPLLLLILLPLAMTMALLWKTKEVILDSVFGTPA
ncbi:MAG TPA: hypothetical protein VLT36_09725 [Candidatus Dormibacteraeota bacterium]|nr:hypothetical protein [Candidatus Dormibacteraeota bacterium]